MNKLSFTIFTATFNRGGYLIDLYNSLTEQTYRSFEWIVIDDGSTDNTESIMSDIVSKSSFRIVYKKQENLGKHVAQNRALALAEGELFLPLDSDDTIVKDGLKILWEAWESINIDERNLYSGVGVHCMDKKGNRIGKAWPQDHMISNDLEMKFVYKMKGEKYGCIRTDVMRKFPNEEVKGNYLSENTVWFRIAQNYKKIYINENIRIYEIRDDSVQKRSYESDVRNAESRICSGLIFVNEFYKWYLKYDLKQAIKLPLSLIKSAVLIDYPIFFSKNGKDSILRMTSSWIGKILIIIGYPAIFFLQKNFINKNNRGTK